MDKKNVLNISKDVSLFSTPKASEPKNTKVFVLPPELLKGLLLENKLPKINLLKDKKESPTVVHHTKNAQQFTKNTSNDKKVQKPTNSISDIKKVDLDSTEKLVKELNVESQLKNGTLDKSTKNVKELKNEEINEFNDDIQTIISNKKIGRGRKKLDRDKDVKKPEIHDKIIKEVCKEKEIKVQEGNKRTPILRVYQRKPRISQNKVINNSLTNDVHTICDNICNEETTKSSNNSKGISNICTEEKGQVNTRHNVEKDPSSKISKLTNPAEFQNDRDTLNNLSIDIRNKGTENLNNNENINTPNIENSALTIETNLQTKNSDLKETQLFEEFKTENLLSSEQNIQIMEEMITQDGAGDVTDEIIIIEETIEEIIEFYDFDTDKDANTEVEDFMRISENVEGMNDDRVNQTIPESDSTKIESDRSNLLVMKESSENIKSVNAELIIEDQLRKDVICNDANQVSKILQNKIDGNCESLNLLKSNSSYFEKCNESLLSEDTNENIAKKESRNSNKLLENQVSASEQNVLSLKLPTENVSKMKSLNFNKQPAVIHTERKSRKKKEISPLIRKTVTTKRESESTENLEVTQNVNENNVSIRRSARLSKTSKRYKPVINKRKQKNGELKENKKRIDLNMENNGTNVLSFNKKTIDERLNPPIKNIKEPVSCEKNEIKITSDNNDSKIVEGKIVNTKFSKEICSGFTDNSNKNILKGALDNEDHLSSKQDKDFTCKSIEEHKTDSIPSDMIQTTAVLDECTKFSSMIIEKTDATLFHENHERSLNDENTWSEEENIFKESNQNITLSQEIPTIMTEIEKQGIIKMNTEYIDETLVNISKSLDEMEDIDNKSDLSDAFDQGLYDMAESQSDTDEIKDNPVAAVPVNNDTLTDVSHNDTVYTHADNITENRAIDFPGINDTLLNESHNVGKAEEINEHKLIESFRKNENIEKILSDNELESSICQENVISDLKNIVSCSPKEKIAVKSDKSCTVDEEIPQMASKFQEEKINETNTELIDDSLANVSKTLEDVENFDSRSNFSDTLIYETSSITESQSDEVKDNSVVDEPVNHDELTDVSYDAVNIHTDEIKENPAVDVPVIENALSDKNSNDAITQENNDSNLIESLEKNKKTDEILNKIDLRSNISHENINVLNDNLLFSTKENICEKNNENCTVVEKIIKMGSEVSEQELTNNENCTVEEEIPKMGAEVSEQELTKMDTKISDETPVKDSRTLECMEIVDTSFISDSYTQETYKMPESQNDSDTIVKDSIFDDLAINNELASTNRNDAIDKEMNDQNSVELFDKTKKNKEEEEVLNNTTKKKLRSKTKDSSVVEPSKIEIHADSRKKRNNKKDLRVDESNSEVNIVQRRSRRLTASRATPETENKQEKEALDSKKIQTRKRNTRSKSKTSESTIVKEKLDKKVNLENESLIEKEDSFNLRSRKSRRTSYKSCEFDSEENLELQTSKNESKYPIRRKSRSGCDESTETNSQEDLELEASKNEPEQEKAVNDEPRNDDENSCSSLLKKRRKRGRPKRTETNSQEALELEASKNEPEQEKAVTDEPRNDDENSCSSPLKKRRKRGRPKRTETNSQEALELEASKNEPEQEKAVSDELGNDDENSCSSLRKERRKRGRPKSTETNSQEDIELEASKNEPEQEKGISDEPGNDDENSCSSPRKKRRKRGRPKGSTISKYDNDYAPPHHSQVQNSPAKETNKRKSNTPGKPEQKSTIVCGKCGVSLLKNQWANHNVATHNNLGWIEGTEKPDYENNEKLLRGILTALIKKRKKLVCEKCRAIQRSVPGHLSHVLFCGKKADEVQALMITCPGCQAVIKPSSLEYHERLHQKQSQEQPKVTNEIVNEITDSGIKTKRKAAEKAISKISEFAISVKADQDDDTFLPDKKVNLNDLRKIIVKPQITKRIPSILQSKWQKSIEAGENAACSQVGCTMTFKTLNEIKQHYLTCNFTPQENYICRICKYQSKLKNEIIQHALQNHATEDEDENEYISDSDNSSDSDCDDSFVKINVDKSQRSSKRYSFVEGSDPLNKKFKFLFKDGVCYTKSNKIFLTGFQWTLEFEEKNYSFNLFNDYTPNAFHLLQTEESKKYFPELNESMPVTNFVKADQNSEWKTMKIFEGQCFNDFPTFFTGGPVWALAWLPIPSFLYFSDNITQFVAISTHPTMDKEYSVGEMYSGKNIIQIWNMGDLSHNANSVSDPKLAYAIAHEGGTVWCLEWCPSGCYDHKDLPGFVEEEKELRRMGLLAAACSDGCIRIYSLIFPEDLPSFKTNKDEETDECLVYKTDPVLMLVVNRKMFDNKLQNWQVTKLSWTKEKGHNVIVGGFSNGYIALWDLTTKSPMLKFKRDNTIFLNPFKHFLAHLHAVTMVYLVPRDNKRYLVTTSLDRYYKFWDLEDISNPRTNLKKSYVTDASWFNHWNCVLLSGDDALSMNNNYTHCWPLREHIYRYYNVLPSNSATFAIDTSDFGNSIANGTLAGEVLAIFPQQMMYINDMKTSLPRKRYFSIVSSVEVVDFQETQKKVSANDETDKKEYNFMPSTYKDSKDRFGLKFCDKLNQFRNGYAKVAGLHSKKSLTCDMMQTVPSEQYPFMSANRVSWNPNCWSFLWLAVGYQNGFVRFIPFKSMAHTNEWNKMLTSHVKRLKAKSDTLDVER